MDILIVVDNSGSMREEWLKLSAKVDDLLGSIAGLDWQIKIITTESVCSVFENNEPLNPKTENSREKFIEGIEVGTRGTAF